MPRALRIAGLVLAMAVLGLLALEGVVRLLHLAPPVDPEHSGFAADPHLPFRRQPHSRISGRSITGEFDYDYRHNGEGFRDTEHAIAKPPGTFRIVVLGDSFTFGEGVPFEETWARRLERMLSERAQLPARVEIINLALPRYFPEAERLVLEHLGLRYEPDLVVVGFVPNDVIDTHLGIDAVGVDRGWLISRRAERLGRWAPGLYLRSHLARMVLGAIAERLPDDRRPRPDEIYRAGGFHEPDWLKVEAELDRMRQLALERGARFALVTIPQRRHSASHHTYPDRRLGRWAESHGAIFVATLPAMLAAAGDAPLYYERDGHCTSAGHAVIAHTVFTALTEAAAVP
jgi:hypothetical protein